jgi:hypothetical protein
MYQVLSCQRIIDNIPRIIDAEFIMPAAEAIRKALERDLHIFKDDAAERCGEFLAESDVNRRRREDLNERKNRLGHAKDAIKKFSSGH